MKNFEVGSLIIRLVLGLTFFVHGLDKFQSGIGNIAGFFESVGIPGFLASPVAGIELIGGICLLLGLGTRVIASAFVVIMVVAIMTVKIGKGFAGGYELDLALMAMAAHLLVAGSQFLALDKLLFAKKSKEHSA